MKQLRITNEAKADLIDIWSYISQNNEDAADALVDKITKKGNRELLTGNRMCPVKSSLKL